MWTQEQSDLGPHCLPVGKNRFEQFARIFSRRHKQTFSGAVFLGALRVKDCFGNKEHKKEHWSFGFMETSPHDSNATHRVAHT